MRRSQKTVWAIGLIALGCAGGYAFLRKSFPKPAVVAISEAAISNAPSLAENPTAVAEKTSETPERAPAGYLDWEITPRRRSNIQEAAATGVREKWMPAIGELTNPIFRRDEAIRLLSEFLTSPDWSIRVFVAERLLEMGSYAGVSMLETAIAEVASGDSGKREVAASAAAALHRYRQRIDHRALYEAWRRTDSPALLHVATMQAVPELREVVLKRRLNGENGYETGYIAAYLGMNDVDSITQYRNLVTVSARAELLAYWALYRSTGDAVQLERLIGAAREAVGLSPASEKNWRDRTSEVLHYLGTTISPQAILALREISDHVAVSENGNVNPFERAFGALFYLHHDDEFVNGRVMAFFEGRFQGSGISRRMMFQIAAARNTPEFRAAAKNYNRSAYERNFLIMKDRPVENFIDLYNVPSVMAPPYSSK